MTQEYDERGNLIIKINKATPRVIIDPKDEDIVDAELVENASDRLNRILSDPANKVNTQQKLKKT